MGEVCQLQDEKAIYVMGHIRVLPKNRENVFKLCQPERSWQLFSGTLRVGIWLISLNDNKRREVLINTLETTTADTKGALRKTAQTLCFFTTMHVHTQPIIPGSS